MMFWKMLEDATEVVSSVAKIAAAPVAITTVAAKEVVKPLSDMVEEVVEVIQGDRND